MRMLRQVTNVNKKGDGQLGTYALPIRQIELPGVH